MKSLGNVEKELVEDNWVVYKTSCKCGSKSCGCEVMIEVDKEFGTISTTFYTDVDWADHWGYFNYDWNWWWKLKHHVAKPFRVFWRRFKACMRLMFTGYVELSRDFIFRDAEHAFDFANALIEGVDYVKDKEKEKEEARKNKFN